MKTRGQNVKLTPLLLASNDCKIDMVEYFIKRPECTKEQRIEGLELLKGGGVTFLVYYVMSRIMAVMCGLRLPIRAEFKM